MSEPRPLSRRDFLTQVSWVAAAAPWFVPLMTTSAYAQDEPIRVGLVGVGSRGTKLLLHLQTIPGVVIAAVCDNYSPNLVDAARRADGARRFTDYRALLDAQEVDALVIATPPSSHADISCAAMRTGCDVFCEKVMALTIEDCDRMMRVPPGDRSSTSDRLSTSIRCPLRGSDRGSSRRSDRSDYAHEGALASE